MRWIKDRLTGWSTAAGFTETEKIGKNRVDKREGGAKVPGETLKWEEDL